MTPKRVIAGPKTMIDQARGVAVDPVNNIIAVGNANPQGILIFNRTDEGDVAPRSIITGPRTGIRAAQESPSVQAGLRSSTAEAVTAADRRFDELAC